MKNEFRFSFMEPRRVDPSEKCSRAFFKSNGYLFHGVKYRDSSDSASFLKKSCKYQGKFEIIRFEGVLKKGILFLKEGDVYMGDLDAHLRPSGSGTFFFKTGAILRGNFENNLVHGKCLLSLPINIFLVLKFKFGILDSWSTKIDLNSEKVSYFKFSKGKFEEDREGEHFQQTLQETFKDVFTPNWLLKDLEEYSQGEFFGSVLLPSGQVFTGFVQKGVVEGWGITFTFQKNYGKGLFFSF